MTSSKIKLESDVKVKIMKADLSIYRDLLQWSSLIFTSVFPKAAPTTLITHYYNWLLKFPLGTEALEVSPFFLGMYYFVTPLRFPLEPPILVQGFKPLNFDEDAPTLGGAVGLPERAFKFKVNQVTDVKLEVEYKKWLDSNYSTEQIMLLCFHLGVTLFSLTKETLIQ